MINLEKYKVVIDGVEYIPYSIAEKAYKEVYDYKTNQTKLDNALSLLDNSIKDISTVLSTVSIDDKNSTRES